MKRSAARTTGISKGLAIGLMYGASLTLLSSLLLALLIYYEKMAWENVGYGIMLLLFASAFLTAKVSYKKTKWKKPITCVASALIYQLFLIILTMLFFGGRYYAIVPTMFPIIAGASASGLLTSGGVRHKSYRYLK